jgi:carboxyl-terminal processing protease
MRHRDQVAWLTVTVSSLAAFSFFAGLGLRGLLVNLTDRAASGREAGYPRLASAAPRLPDPNLRPSSLFFEVLKKLKLYYVEPLPPDTELAYGSIEAMLNELRDPNTRLLSKVETEALQQAMGGYYPGMGAVLTVRRHTTRRAAAAADLNEERPTQGSPTGIRTITVVSVAPGSPADKAGVLPGDRITEVDGHWVAPAHIAYRVLTQITDDLGPQDGRPKGPDEEPEAPEPNGEREKERKEAEEARNRFRGATDLPTALEMLLGGTGEHELTIERGNPTETLKVKVKLGTTHVDPFTSRMLDDATGYVRFLSFNGDSVRLAQEALAGFQRQGAKNLVLDLRRCAGGSLEAATGVAGLLMGNVKFAVIKERDAERKLVDRPLMSHGTVAFRPTAVSVLVDGGTAGAAELLAAAARDNLGARLVGSPTFGDGTEQELVRLDGSAAMVITRARMLTGKGGDFEGKGLKPDVPAEGDAMPAALAALSAPAGARAN